MKRIPLSRGLFAIVDNSDYPEVSKYKWYAVEKGHKKNFLPYAARNVSLPNGNKTVITLHRVLLGIYDRSVCVDHKNGNSLDNRRKNLRTCTNAENIRNQKVHIDSVSGIKGVHRVQTGWRAEITYNRVKYHLGIFRYKKDAIKARQKKEKELFGKFRRVIKWK